MTAQIISGKEVAEQIREELRPRVEKLKGKGVVPGLAAILVGEDPAALSYLRGIAKGCEKVGLFTETVNLPADVTQEKLAAKVEELNNAPKFHGIIIQRPLRIQRLKLKIITTDYFKGFIKSAVASLL